MRYPVPPKTKEFKDDWGTGAREGYEDRGTFRPPRAPKKDPGSPILRYLGAACIAGGMFWGTWLVTQGGDVVNILQTHRGPVILIGLGVISSVLGKYLRF
jgi:hypothetical protein